MTGITPIVASVLIDYFLLKFIAPGTLLLCLSVLFDISFICRCYCVVCCMVVQSCGAEWWYWSGSFRQTRIQRETFLNETEFIYLKSRMPLACAALVFTSPTTYYQSVKKKTKQLVNFINHIVALFLTYRISIFFCCVHTVLTYTIHIHIHNNIYLCINSIYILHIYFMPIWETNRAWTPFRKENWNMV